MTKTWVVTGAGRGLGLEFVRQVKERGDAVVATARDVQGAGDLRALADLVLPLDVSSDESVAAFAAELGDRPVDVLLNNAGIYGERQALGHLDFEDLARVFDVNALGPLRVTQALVDNLRAGEGKLVCQMTSKMGSIADNSSGGVYGYRASKAALNAIGVSLARDLAADGIATLLLHPGWVRTGMGGPSAPLSVADSVRGLLKVIDDAGPERSGRFFAFDGEELPW